MLGIEPFLFGKYSTDGPFTEGSMRGLGVPERYVGIFADAANGGNSRRTWKQRRTVLRTIEKCARETATPLDFPWGDRELQTYVGWSMEEGKKGNTITQYISNVASLHREMGLQMNVANKHLITTVVKGHGNLAENAPGRIPMTPDLMFHLKLKLSRSNLPVPERRLVWVIATTLFQGSFRVGELLSPTKKKFCPDSTLLGSDINWESATLGGRQVDLLKVRVKCPKETRGHQVVDVELFDLSDCFYNCVSAFRKWRGASSLPLDPNLPLFRHEDGSLVTPNYFNMLLKDLMQDKVQYMQGFIATHSFRSGLASVMAQLGYSDEQIKLQGRWRGDAFMNYIKLGRAARLEDQWALANKIANLVLPGGQVGRH